MDFSVNYGGLRLTGKGRHRRRARRKVRRLSLQIPVLFLLIHGSGRICARENVQSAILRSETTTFERLDVRVVQGAKSFLLRAFALMAAMTCVSIVPGCQRTSRRSLIITLLDEAALTPTLNSLNQ